MKSACDGVNGGSQGEAWKRRSVFGGVERRGVGVMGLGGEGVGVSLFGCGRMCTLASFFLSFPVVGSKGGAGERSNR